MSSSNISGSPSIPSANPSQASSEVIPPNPTSLTNSVESPDFQMVGQVDVLDSGQVVTQQFISAQQWGKKAYPADPSHPTLQLPDPEGEISPKPFPSAWQRAANKFFKDLVAQQVVRKMNPASAEATKEGGPALTYSKSEVDAQVNTIMQSVATGNMSQLSDEDQQIAASATEETQKAWKLPDTWTLGSKDAAAWTPTVIDVIPPVGISADSNQVLGENLEKLLTSFETAGKKISDEIPPDDPKQKDVDNYLRVITTALRDLKALLDNIQLQSAEQSDKFSELKYDMLKQHEADLKKIQEQQKKIDKQRKKAKKMNKDMKIVSITVSAAIVLVSIVAIGASMGAATGPSAFLIAMACSSSAMFAYTIADSEYGLTAQVMEAFANWKADLPYSGGVKQWIDAAFAIAAIVVLIAAIMASGGGAAAGVAAGATQAAVQATTQQVAKQVLIAFIAQITMQASIMFIMSSNIIPDLGCRALNKLGLVDKDDQEAMMIAQIMFMIMTLLAVVACSSYSGPAVGGSQAGQAVGTTTKTTSETIKQALESMVNYLKKMVDSIIQSLQNAAKAVKDAWEAPLKAIQHMLSSIGTYLKDTGAGFVQTFNLPQFGRTGAYDWLKFTTQLQNLLQMGKIGTEAGVSFSLAFISFSISDILKELGENEKAQEITKMLIQLLEQMLSGFQGDLKSGGELYKNLNSTLDEIFKSTSQSFTQATQQFMA